MNQSKKRKLLITLEALETDDDDISCESDLEDFNSLFLKNNTSMFMLSQQCQITIQALSKKGQRTIWVKPRYECYFEKDLQENDEDFFKQNLRVNRATFQYLCTRMTEMKTYDTRFRKAIPIEKKIAIALYTLGSSAEYRTIANVFGVGISSVLRIVMQFCSTLLNVFKEEFMDFDENIQGFESMGMPQCYAAIDGCHIKVTPPAEDASDFYNFKGWYSTVLLALVDFRCRFIYINVGAPGRSNDSQLYESSNLKKYVIKNFKKRIIIIDDVEIPVFLIGDSAFKLDEHMMNR
uniref:CSON004844 protein n=1 Tax=Culicoides sonorensis TaxID=179676 RepID=A0A336LY34_CULSO